MPQHNYRIEPLGPDHNRAGFRSNVAELDEYLQRQAGQDARRKVAAPFVLSDDGGSVFGYYTLSAYSIRLNALPEGFAKRLPRYPLVPATLLGRLAVDNAHRGRGFGRLLLMDALHRSWRNTKEVASAAVVVDTLDNTARAFYLHHEFIPLMEHPKQLFLPMATIAKLF